MRKGFSIYEFGGILVPAVLLMYFLQILLNETEQFLIFEYKTPGEAFVFLVVAYGLGHLLHGIGNIFEKIVWRIIGGMPTGWLTKKPRFRFSLLDEFETKKITDKIYSEFGEEENKDYGMLIYHKIKGGDKAERADIFNANYSMFRALTVSCFLLILFSLFLNNEIFFFASSVFFILGLRRMIRFGQHYAKEVYRTYLTSF